MIFWIPFNLFDFFQFFFKVNISITLVRYTWVNKMWSLSKKEGMLNRMARNYNYINFIFLLNYVLKIVKNKLRILESFYNKQCCACRGACTDISFSCTTQPINHFSASLVKTSIRQHCAFFLDKTRWRSTFANCNT